MTGIKGIAVSMGCLDFLRSWLDWTSPATTPAGAMPGLIPERAEEDRGSPDQGQRHKEQIKPVHSNSETP
jgi:hypothetical protein